ncbi:MAG: AMP-binding protein [Candidatus Gastranaerophilales bacterium]|nr:AMP-binding protein [Candidatus Gastranaerophilales bacterium]
MAVVENTDFPLVKLAIKEDLANIDTIGKVFLSKLFSYPDKTFLKYKKYGSFRNISFAETFNSMKSLYIQLCNLGLVKGDKVLFISENRQQLITAALGATLSGFVSVPVHPGFTSIQIQEIIDSCKPKCIIISDDRQLEKINNIKNIDIITFDNLSNKILYYKDIVKKYRNSNIDFEKAIYEINSDNLAYILYQYNESGKFEGIKLSHNNILSSVKQVYEETEVINSDDIILFNLPFSFIEGIFEIHLSLYSSAICAIADDTGINILLENVKEVNASIFSSTLNIWKKFFDKFTQIHSIETSESVFRDTIGESLKKGFCWGISQNNSAVEFFKNLNLDIVQFYGFAETSGPYAYLKSDRKKLKSFVGIEVKTEKDSEILVKKESILARCVNNQNPLMNGWFKTGDIGIVDEDGNIQIHGKKRDYITLLSGYIISPQRIENLIDNKFISKVVIIGEKREFLSALIVPNIDYLKEYAHKELKIKYKTTDDLIKDRWVKALYRLIFENLNKDLAVFEKIKGFALLLRPFSVDSTELTLTGKPIREIISIKRNHEIESIYKAPFSKLLFETSINK